MSTSGRILVRGLNWLGDAVMSLPALQRLREAHPSAHITLVTPEKLTSLWQASPLVQSILPFHPGESPFSVARRIRAGKFDLALVFPNSPRAALEVWWGRVPRRVGLRAPWRNAFLTEALSPNPGHIKMRKRTSAEIQLLIVKKPPAPEQFSPLAHHIHHYLRIVSAVGASSKPVAPAIPVSEEEMQAAWAKFQLPNPAGSKPVILGLNAGAEFGPAKRWPLDHFVAMAKAVRTQTNSLWLLFGGPGDMERAAALERALHESSAPSIPSVVNLAGQTTLRELAALFRACRIVVTNDTGPMHLAAAVGARVIALFGSTEPALTGPGLPGDPRHALLQSRPPCQPCFLRECPIDLRCLREIQPDQVTEKLLSFLSQPVT